MMSSNARRIRTPLSSEKRPIEGGTALPGSVRSVAWRRVIAAVAIGIVSGGILTASVHAQATPESSAPSQASRAVPSDPLASVLDQAGVTESDLGFRPAGAWLRYPDPNGIRFKNRFFDTFFSDPGSIYPTIAAMARAGERFLEPSVSDSQATALFQLAYYTGWDPYITGFRDYNAGMSLQPRTSDSIRRDREDDPLTEAIAALWMDAGRTFDYVTLETPADWPSLRDMVRAKVAPLDPELRAILAQAVLDLMESRQWHRRAFRDVDARDLIELWTVRDWGDTQADGGEYFPQIERIDDRLDHASLVTSSRKAVYAAGRLAVSLRAWQAKGGRTGGFAPAVLRPDPKNTPPEEGKLSAAQARLYAEKRNTRSMALAEQQLDLWTPAGRIVVSGEGPNVHEERDLLLLVDLGGNDTYREAVGATSSLTLPVSIAVDLSGDDRYESVDEMGATQGSGIFGTGVLIDWSGRDTYQAGKCAQGYGFFGTGLLADMEGNDVYDIGVGGQGAGFWGVGLLFDRGGDDLFRMDGTAQGYGGIGGVGTLLDLRGNDTYTAETDSRKVPRPDYTHSAEYVNGTNGQGAGMGRRGDLNDGHSWAGGLGTLLDLQGDDDYLSGNWTLGAGYWYGMGFLYDKSGNDRYRATTFSIASGAHFCVGGLFDEAGDDVYEGLADARTGMGFGHDFTVAILFDRSGNDVYRFGWEGIGDAINTSQAFFVDGGGDDTYVFHAGANGFGATGFNPDSWPPTLEANYQYRATQIGLFLDLGGTDRYLDLDPATGAESVSTRVRDDLLWIRPEDPSAGNHRHYGIFRDGEGDVNAIRWFQSGIR